MKTTISKSFSGVNKQTSVTVLGNQNPWLYLHAYVKAGISEPGFFDMFCLYKDSNLKNVNREEAIKLSILCNTINTKKETFTG